MRRVLVVGITGAGKTTAARRIAATIGVPFHELDDLAIGPGWSTPAGFADSVAAVLREPGWVIDSYGYDQVRDAMWAAADTVVWLDYPRRVVLWRVVRRSLTRSATGQPVFGGNYETWAGWLSADHPVWWAMRQFRARRAYLAERTGAPASRHLTTVRLRRARQFDTWLETQQ